MAIVCISGSAYAQGAADPRGTGVAEEEVTAEEARERQEQRLAAGGAAAERVGPRVLSALGAMTRQVQQIGDWDQEFGRYVPFIERFFEQNGWTDEANQFAREMALEVGRIPPWEYNKRLDKVIERLDERYEFTDQQSAALQQKVNREIGAMAYEHAATLFKHTREFLATRLRDDPFTSEQVARWTKESEGMFVQARQRIQNIADEMKPTMTPRQKAILERDMRAFQQRMKTMDELRARWAQGEWRPEDWGFSEGSIAPATPAAAAPSPQPKAAAPAVRQVFDAHDEGSWERYVRIFTNRYNLDEGQARSALSILDELLARARDYRRLHAEELAEVPPAQRQTSWAYEPLRRLFEELQRRLEPIPSTAQRREADLRAAALSERRPPEEDIPPVPPDAPPE